MNEAIQTWTESSPCEELDEYCKKGLLKGLSFKAVDKQGNIVGVSISGATSLNENADKILLEEADHCKNPKFQKILYIIAKREEGAKLWERFPQDKEHVEVFVTATDPNWRKRGIMNKLIAETERQCKQKNLRILRLDTSSAYSAMSAERLGFICVYKAFYKDLKKDGQPLIIPKEPHVADSVYIKTLYD
ncbi:unnamed protein product [Diatraea saccharalis]|uniref:N-acetyltransferase domain-containing protein n=1 Tax=Diatraea saccharalis TaxID=40085 RepID=A0A9P0C0Q8_9NEOP|nr:unnamed protein product [Diatraea saccharalis]